jgi:hypothetical protein
MEFISGLPAHIPLDENISAVPFMSSDIPKSSDQIFDDVYVQHAQEAMQKQPLFADGSPSSFSESPLSTDQFSAFEFPTREFPAPQQNADLWTGVPGGSNFEHADINMVPSVIDEEWMTFMSGLFNSNGVSV